MKKTAQKKPAKKNGAKAPAETAAPSAEAGTPFDLKSITRVEIPSQDQEMALADIAVVYNARTEFEQEMAELTASIAKWGVKTRLWVYPLDEPAANGAQYGLIAGERRYRAATAAGLLQVPVTVFACDVRTAEELGLVDNIQRQNLSEIDEAFAYKRMIEKHGMKAWAPDDAENSVGHKLGVSKTAVYAALKLTELPKLGIDAVRGGTISPSVGIRIARIPNKQAQMEALKLAISNEWTDEDAAENITRLFATELKGAPFDRKDETLSKRGSCEKCPYRSGNMAELFPDLAKGRGDICTDTACFRGKCAESFERRAVEHRRNGGKVLSDKEAKKIGLEKNWSSIAGGYVELSDSTWEVGDGKKTWAQLLKPLIEDGSIKTTLAKANNGSEKHFEIVEREAAMVALKKAGIVKAKKGGDMQSDAEAKHRKQRELAKKRVMHQLGAVAEAGSRFVLEELDFLRTVGLHLVHTAGADTLRLICARRQTDTKSFKLADHNSPTAAHGRALSQIADEGSLAELHGLMAELMAAPAYVSDDGKLAPERRAPLFNLLGIDGKAIYKDALEEEKEGEKVAEEEKNTPAQMKELARAAAKKQGGGKMTEAERKALADAARKRWALWRQVQTAEKRERAMDRAKQAAPAEEAAAV